MKSIGFVDFYISEWHANNYPAWISAAAEKLNMDVELKYVWAEEFVSPVDGRNTDEWCAEFGAERCNTIEELCEKSDYIFILSPSNPEKHLSYAAEVLKYRKNTYIDKTFAPDLNTAQEIFKIAEENKTAFFSSSALRYSTELDDMNVSPTTLTTFGGGGNLEEYIIHQIEMAVKVMKEAPLRVKVEKQTNGYVSTVDFENDKSATMVFSPSLPFMAVASTADKKSIFRQMDSDFFLFLIEDILRFFESGTVPFDSNETLNVIKIRDGVIEGMQKDGEWVKL